MNREEKIACERIVALNYGDKTLVSIANALLNGALSEFGEEYLLEFIQPKIPELLSIVCKIKVWIDEKSSFH